MISNIERKTWADYLKGEEYETESPLLERSRHSQNSTDQCTVWTFEISCPDFEEFVFIFATRKGRIVKRVWFDIHAGKAMPGTRKDLKELRDGVEEVENLWNEQQEECLAEVTMDAHHSEGHTSEITIRIANEDWGREPIELEQPDSHSEKGDDEDEREHLTLARAKEIEIVEFEEEDTASDHIWLPRLETIDSCRGSREGQRSRERETETESRLMLTCIDVDRIGTEDSEQAHV
jgi:hypothetical protein